MKRMKKLSVVFVALAMMMTMAFTALAGSGSITIKETQEGREYELYRIFDLTHTNKDDTFDKGTDSVVYTINSAWEEFFASEGADYIVVSNNTDGTLSPIVVNNVVKYINITESNVQDFSADVLEYALKKEMDAVDTVDGTGSDVTAKDLELGYYLVYPTDATEKTDFACLSSLTSTVPNGEVVIKATYPTIDKEVDDISVELGQIVNYTITGVVPNTSGYNEYVYTIKDTMSPGLTFGAEQRSEIKLYIDKDGDEEIDADEMVTINKNAVKATENGFELTITVTDFQDYIGEKIWVKYPAVVNESAVSVISNNKASLVYGHDPENTVETKKIEKEVYSAKIVIDKYDATNTSAKLAGAEFVLKNSDNKYYATASNAATADESDWKVVWVDSKNDTSVVTVTTDENGAAYFPGLENGTYYLEETKAPAGYNLLEKAVEVVIDGEQEDKDGNTVYVLTYTAPIENNSGTLLPSTGGMGTTMFYVFGGILVLAAMVLFVVKIRMKNEN